MQRSPGKSLVGPYPRSHGGHLLSAGKRALSASFPYFASAATAGLASYNSKRQRSSGESSVNTYQHDLVTRYRKRRMPRRRRKRYVSRVKFVQSVIAKAQPLQEYSNLVYGNLTSSANKGGYWGQLFGGTRVNDNDEILKMFQSMYNLAAYTDCYPYSILLKSMCLDIMVTNNGTKPVIIDVYKLRCRSSYGSNSSITTQFAAHVGDIGAAAGAGAEIIAADDLGITLFDVPNMCRHWSISEKKEMILGAGNCATFQMRKHKKKWISGRQLLSYPQSIPGFTEAIFFTWHGAPSNAGGAGAAQFDATTLTVGVSINCKFGQPPGNIQKPLAESEE